VGAALYRALRRGGPALPARLASPADLEVLEAARAALLGAPFPGGFEGELGGALDALAPDGAARFSVRSSAPGEESAGTLAAGVYRSLLGIRRDEVAAALRAVLASFLTPAAWAYAGAAAGRGRMAAPAPADAAPAVLVHPFVTASAAGAVAVPAAGDAAIDAAAGGAPDATAVRIDVHAGEPTATARAAIADGARRAAARHGPVELEWVADGDAVTFLQRRAFTARPAPATAAPATAAPAGWTWDAVHNPLPLSPAQEGLVALVDARVATGIRQRVIGGYLFCRRDPPEPDAPASSLSAARDVFERLRRSAEARLAASAGAPLPLAEALDLFVAAYGPLYGTIQPALVSARAALGALLARHLPQPEVLVGRLVAGAPSAATRRRAAAAAIATALDAETRRAAVDAYLAAFGDESPRWDVAEPTFREAPQRLLLLAAAPAAPSAVAPPALALDLLSAETRLGLPSEARESFDRLLDDARTAAAIGEDDDALYARLQAAVRRALLATGEALARAGRLGTPDDVFYLPLSIVADIAASAAPPSDLAAEAARGRAAHRAAHASPPLAAAAGARGRGWLRAIAAAGGRAVGPAAHHPTATAMPLAAGTVLVAATLLPTELPLLSPAALVVETGTALGHVAAQARERGLPAVVGAAGARAAIPEGALVAVDGDLGEVVVIETPR
jgi:phosphohistidine swiveling domain-containing protein